MSVLSVIRSKLLCNSATDVLIENDHKAVIGSTRCALSSSTADEPRDNIVKLNTPHPGGLDSDDPQVDLSMDDGFYFSVEEEALYDFSET